MAALGGMRWLVAAGVALGVCRMLVWGVDGLTAIGVALLLVLWLVRPKPRPWREAYYCQTCGAVYPLEPPSRCTCGCVRFFREDPSSPSTKS